jgi:hypothetical protein
MSRDNDIIENNPDIAAIKDDEISKNVEESESDGVCIIIEDQNGTKLKLGNNKKSNKSKKKAKSTTVADNETDIPLKKDIPPTSVDGDENNELPKVDKEPVKTTTKKGDKKESKLAEKDEEGMQIIRESKEIITKIGRAKLRAFALINQALKETGQFEVSVVLNDSRKTVSSAPLGKGSIEDVIMSTTMEMLDLDSTNNKKKK